MSVSTHHFSSPHPLEFSANDTTVNMGDMIQKWSGGAYKSARHRVIFRGEDERLSCATFWHGDLQATNPLNPDDPAKETVAQLLVKRFKNQFSAPKKFADDMLSKGTSNKLASVPQAVAASA